ncbi:Hypothetical protein BSSP2_II1046 [Brucella suis bv. 2]|nr:Hypothetical protein BSSP3_II1049 [Brucella suis bv. 2]AIB23105.1 Hypothetical protein BSPT1_II1035 [Brucella suis bv. 2]AIB26462.1 Hypothetical protein BSPT2_II1037 [Brucella suis bv. 2]AIB29855.1 Hypothetical protein BSSP1_II1038 [Brucella suis bv. 2]AIB33231.1 Hypothetical protein BSSP2_II1046 [Brucella suis bv. 2]
MVSGMDGQLCNAAMTSFFWMRPPGPVPPIRSRSIPASLARRLARGVAMALPF